MHESLRVVAQTLVLAFSSLRMSTSMKGMTVQSFIDIHHPSCTYQYYECQYIPIPNQSESWSWTLVLHFLRLMKAAVMKRY
jgi:hypothetical protein